jgi:hypothetical protein
VMILESSLKSSPSNFMSSRLHGLKVLPPH